MWKISPLGLRGEESNKEEGKKKANLLGNI